MNINSHFANRIWNSSQYGRPVNLDLYHLPHVAIPIQKENLILSCCSTYSVVLRIMLSAGAHLLLSGGGAGAEPTATTILSGLVLVRDFTRVAEDHVCLCVWTNLF